MNNLFRIIFAISGGLMVILAFVNKGYANDDHFTVIEIIARFSKLPESTQCWQCYHPKLYHFLVAKIWNLFDIQTDYWKHLSAQLFNAALGLGTLFIVQRYIKELKFENGIKIIVFALIALNPRVISVFAQATNDGIIIFLGNLGFYAALKLFRKPSLKYSLLLVLAVALGAMSKLNFGVYLTGAIITLIALSILHKNYLLSISKGYLGTLLIMVFVTAVAAFTFNGYYENIRKTGKAFTYNTPLKPLPHFFEYEAEYIPGIRTIYSGYFKFHYFDLIKHPRVIDEAQPPFRKHMTSHFSQIYGRTHFLYFDHWPEQWRTFDPAMITIGSITLAIAIVPSLILILGLVLLAYTFFSYLINRNWEKLKTDDSWVILLFFTGYLLFSVFFSLFGRSFIFMKDIYLFPGLLTVVVPLCLGHSLIFRSDSILRKAYYGFIAVLVILYIVPVINLIYNLIIEVPA